jgi:hypothetical protein
MDINDEIVQIKKDLKKLDTDCCKLNKVNNLKWHDPNIFSKELIALESATKIIVQTTDEFLQSFGINDYYKKEIIDWLKTLKVESNRIGVKSGFGSIYWNPKDDYVLKIVNSCPDKMYKDPNDPDRFNATPDTSLIGQTCRMALEGDIVYRIPSTVEKKKIVLAPNYISESVIGILLSKLETYTPGFMRVYGFQYDNTVKNFPSYTISEKLDQANYDNIIDINKPNESLYYVLFQITQALNTAQALHKYTHYDLHSENLMIRKRSNNINIYEIGNGNYLYTYFDYDTVLIDYGFNRLETKDTILSGRASYNIPPEFKIKNIDIFEFGSFNPYIDLFSVIYFLFLKSKPQTIDKSSTDSTQIPNPWFKFKDILLYLLSMYLNVKKDHVEHIIKFHLSLNSSSTYFWRVAPEKLATSYSNSVSGIEFNHCLNPQQMLVRIAKEIEKFYNKNNPFFIGKRINENTVKEFLVDNKFLILDRIIIPDSSTKIYILPKYTERMYTRYLNYTVPPYYKDIINEIFTVNTCLPLRFKILYPTIAPNTNQYIHFAKINKNTLNTGRKFHFDCCRIDLRKFMQHSTRNGCIAINAGFFKIYDNYTPIGYFKTNDYTSTNDIPPLDKDMEAYSKWYGLLAIDKYGFLKIDNNLENHKLYDSVITCGPILVYNGKKIITEEILKEKEFKWDPKINMPGQLAHASQRNPRSAIFLNDNEVFFIHVEGRNDRGDGLNCAELAELAVLSNAKYAINLDGGRSSQIVFREPGSEEIQISHHLTSYPVGNIISFW